MNFKNSAERFHETTQPPPKAVCRPGLDRKAGAPIVPGFNPSARRAGGREGPRAAVRRRAATPILMGVAAAAFTERGYMVSLSLSPTGNRGIPAVVLP